MELIEIYKGFKIFKVNRTGFYKIETFMSGDISSLDYVKKVIDIRTRIIPDDIK